MLILGIVWVIKVKLKKLMMQGDSAKICIVVVGTACGNSGYEGKTFAVGGVGLGIGERYGWITSR